MAGQEVDTDNPSWHHLATIIIRRSGGMGRWWIGLLLRDLF